ncbi:MAG: ABC transporter permease [Actinomycetota bacterium]
MARYAARRIAWALVVVLLISLITFLIYAGLPPNNAAYETFTHGGLTERASRLTRHYFGLDRPFVVQYVLFLQHLMFGDRYGWPGLWYSFQTRSALRPIIASRAIVTTQLVAGAAVIWVAVGIPLGIVAARRPRSVLDRAATGFAVLGVSTPAYLIGTLALYTLWYRLRIAPGTGYSPIGAGVLPWFQHMFLPWLTLSISFIAIYSRMTRASVLDAMGEDFIRTARAKGASERAVLVRHVLLFGLTPMLTMLGMDLGQLVGGAILVEIVFNLPGLGSYAVQSVGHGDLYALMDISIVVAVAVTFGNLVVDLLYARLDPRVRYR